MDKNINQPSPESNDPRQEELLRLIEWLGPNSYHNANRLEPHVGAERSGGAKRLLELYNSNRFL